jgi:phage protein D
MPVRHPTAMVTVAGQIMQCEDVSVHVSRDAKTDTMSGTVSLYGGNPGASFWGSQGPMAVQCQISDGNGKSAQLFDGLIDSVECDFGAGKVTFSARDKSAKMLDKKSGKKHLNKKPHDIVKEYASDNGLSCDADEFGDKAGRTFQVDYVALTHRISDWHAVQHLAEQHGMAAYATGGKLYFKKTPEKLPVYPVFVSPPTIAGDGNSNILRVTAKRNVALGKSIKTTVHTWNHKNQKKYDGVHTEQGSGGTQEYHLHHPGLTQEQANARAKAHNAKATKHEMELSIELPGDPTISARMNILLSGTGSAWDQEHEIMTVEHKISVHSGYVTSIQTKSKSKKRGG